MVEPGLCVLGFLFVVSACRASPAATESIREQLPRARGLVVVCLAKGRKGKIPGQRGWIVAQLCASGKFRQSVSSFLAAWLRLCCKMFVYLPFLKRLKVTMEMGKPLVRADCLR